MKLMSNNQRPSELFAACALVSGGSGWPTAPVTSRVPAGHAAVKGGLGVSTSQIQAQRAQGMGTSVLASALKAKDAAKVERILVDVRGIPPRGRPV
jgi:hypothetical protein